MFRYADNCTEALMLSREAFFGLYDQYNQLEDEAKLQRDNAINDTSCVQIQGHDPQHGNPLCRKAKLT